MSKAKIVEISFDHCNWDDDVGRNIMSNVTKSVDDVNDKAMQWASENSHATVLLGNRVIYRSRSSEINGLKA